MRAEFDVKTELFLIIDELIGRVPVTEISTLEPGKISTTAGTEILGGTTFNKENFEDYYWKESYHLVTYYMKPAGMFGKPEKDLIQ